MIERESFPMTTETGNQAIVTGKPGMSDEAKKAVAEIVDAAAADMNRPVDRIVNLGDLYAGTCECGARAYHGLASKSGPEGCVEAIHGGRVYCEQCLPEIKG